MYKKKMVGKRLQEVREELGMMKKDFALILGMSPAQLNNTERERLNPQFHHILNLIAYIEQNEVSERAKALSNIRYLIGGEVYNPFVNG